MTRRLQESMYFLVICMDFSYTVTIRWRKL
uniref:Uncharacterized protein n=1 Tax=Arundo donax TaxID=35708 RepID=A0A0A9GX55_ARUDO